ncbi:protein EMBRYO DEFECTIVE 514-like [Trifolium pratense]|uniref:protein EMBRYO DEFECTIVE 514-like n=1 Tax=Trifolium pratense TaxID=57577 RepID=UPI001E6929BF|nr:protein EMBRYO DEFECTIVE 514-like [Trifolium pratense]XP_045790344.1 protein EMBRYO DEFECTIVE 514-like [Trifolium pratense]
MTETAAPEVIENAEPAEVSAVDSAMKDESNQKRTRDEDEKGVSKKQKKKKKQKVEAEEKKKVVEAEEKKKPSGPVKLGHKTFASSLELFDYFNTFLHAWRPNLNVNKYEHTMLLELLMKGHPEAEKKISGETCAFQVRRHPTWKSKCFFLIKEDDSADDFSFRKCVDNILPLPEAMQVKHDANTALACPGGGKHRGGGKKGKSKH